MFKGYKEARVAETEWVHGVDVGEVVGPDCEAINVLVLIVYFNRHEMGASRGF